MPLLERHLLDLVVLVGSAIGVACRPRLTPYVVVIAVLLSSTSTHAMTTDGLVLAGSAIGLATHRMVLWDWKVGPLASAPLVLLGALDLLILGSLLANRYTPQASLAAQGTLYILSRTILIATVLVLSPQNRTSQVDWLLAGAVGTTLLGLVRGMEIAGAPLQKIIGDPLAIQFLGDLGQPGTWNLYAAVMIVGGLLALSAAELLDRRGRILALRGMALFLFAMAGTSESRTALVVGVLVLSGLAIIADQWRRRALLGCFGLAFVLAAILPGVSVLNKPVLVTQAVDAAVPVTTPITPPATSGEQNTIPQVFRPPAGLTSTWRVLLDQPDYRFDQTFERPSLLPHGNYLTLLARAASSSPDVHLRVAVNGTVAAELTAPTLRTYYTWIHVPLPDGAIAGGGAITVSLSAAGDLDSQRRYVAVAGINSTAPNIRAQAFVAGRPVEGNLSADPGVHRGMVLLFLNGEVPTLRPLPSTEASTLDQSISDRLSLWRTAWHIFLRHPLLGTGFYTFGTVERQEPSGVLFTAYANAHSDYVELLVDLGALGPVVFFALLTGTFIALLGWPPTGLGPERSWRASLTGAVGVMLLTAVSQTWLADTRSAMFFWIVLLVAGGSYRRSLVPTRGEHNEGHQGNGNDPEPLRQYRCGPDA